MELDLRSILRAAEDVTPGQFDDAIRQTANYFGTVTPAVVTELVKKAIALELRVNAAESMANEIFTSITQPNNVLIWRGAAAMGKYKDSAELRSVIPKKATGIVLPDGVTIDILDEDDMRRHGWVRIPADTAVDPVD